MNKRLGGLGKYSMPSLKDRDRHMGPRFDGGDSPMGKPVVLNDEYDTLEDVLLTKDDCLSIANGKVDAVRSGWVREQFRKLGVDADKIARWPTKKRMKLLKKLDHAAQRDQDKYKKGNSYIDAMVRENGKITSHFDTMAEMFASGEPDDPVLWTKSDGEQIKTTVDVLRRVWNKCSDGIPVEEFDKLPKHRTLRVCEKISALMTVIENNAIARRDLYLKLVEWNRGVLTLERPQGSSLHHFLGYDVNGANINDVGASFDDCQIVLVENDWGAAVPQMEGEWRVPFKLMCWEFRLSGVRVLAITDVDDVYGSDGHWTVDGYEYELGCASLPPGKPYGAASFREREHELRRTAKLCYDTIRATCVMLDAQVAHRERVAASTKLKEQRVREGKAPLRDHYVVRLLHEEHRSYHRARSAGGGVARSPQRGHWRKGTWVHFDDQDSGQVQYANDGGFMVSKTWRRWHFAGDPKNIIHKEYRI